MAACHAPSVQTARRPRAAPKVSPAFDLETFLSTSGVDKEIVEYGAEETIFTQEDSREDVLYIQTGAVKLSVLSKTGKKAVVAMLGPGELFGEGCLAGQLVRMGSATATTASAILLVRKKEMVRLLHKQHAVSDRFIAHMLARNVRIEEDLVDQLFNSSEKRLARTLLLLARYAAAPAHPRRPTDLTGDACRNGRDDSLPRELLPEQVQEIGLHRVQRSASDHHQQLAAECRVTRLKADPEASKQRRAPGPRPMRQPRERIRVADVRPPPAAGD